MRKCRNLETKEPNRRWILPVHVQDANNWDEKEILISTCYVVVQVLTVYDDFKKVEPVAQKGFRSCERVREHFCPLAFFRWVIAPTLIIADSFFCVSVLMPQVAEKHSLQKHLYYPLLCIVISVDPLTRFP